jgi:peptidoglycan/LPS O-acetylase OafA/YrhL
MYSYKNRIIDFIVLIMVVAAVVSIAIVLKAGNATDFKTIAYLLTFMAASIIAGMLLYKLLWKNRNLKP